MSKKPTSTKITDQLNGKSIDLSNIPASTFNLKNSTLNKKTPSKVTKTSNDKKPPRKVTSQAKERITVQISKDTIERVKDCVYWNRLTVAQFVEEALEAALKKAEKENGKSFQKRRSELKPGRPIK